MLKNKIIIIPIAEPWDHSADFLRQTALTLSKNNLVYIYDQNNHYFFLKRGRKLNYPQHKNIIFYQVKYYLPFERLKFINKLNRHLSFKLFLRKHSTKDKIIWFFYPQYSYFSKIKKKKTIKVYDCVDYYEGSQKKEQTMIENVDYFFVNSLALKNLHENKNKKAIYIDSQGFYQPNEKKIKSIDQKKNKPVIGYVGGINCRLDYPLLDRLIKNHPEWLFVFYGPEQKIKNKDTIYKTQYWIKKIRKYKNSSFGLEKNRQKLYGIIKNFDVTIIPYNLDIIFNKYCYPMKIFEYFYLGKPVVSSAILELKQEKFQKFVKISSTYEEWEQNINYFLKNKLSQKETKIQKQMAIENSWEQKIEKISQIISLKK